jgi:hypothetical protein
MDWLTAASSWLKLLGVVGLLVAAGFAALWVVAQLKRAHERRLLESLRETEEAARLTWCEAKKDSLAAFRGGVMLRVGRDKSDWARWGAEHRFFELVRCDSVVDIRRNDAAPDAR